MPQISLPPWANAGGETWDYIRLGGVLFQGVTTVSGPVLKRRLPRSSRRGRAGSHGSRTVSRGQEPCEFTITLHCWRDSHRDQVAQIRQRCAPHNATRDARSGAVDVEYPSLADAGITQVFITEISAEKADDGAKSGTTVEIKATEYRPPPPRARSVTRTVAAPTDVANDLADPVRAAVRSTPIPPPSQTGASGPLYTSASQSFTPSTNPFMSR